MLNWKRLGILWIGLSSLASGVAAGTLCESTPHSIPDGTLGGISVPIDVPDSGRVASVRVFVGIDHPWVGDLLVFLVKGGGSRSAILFDRPGQGPTSTFGCSGDDVIAFFRDDAAVTAQAGCSDATGLTVGPYRPAESFSRFDNLEVQDTWDLNIWDLAPGQAGQVLSWCLVWELGIFVDGFESGDTTAWSAVVPGT